MAVGGASCSSLKFTWFTWFHVSQCRPIQHKPLMLSLRCQPVVCALAAAVAWDTTTLKKGMHALAVSLRKIRTPWSILSLHSQKVDICFEIHWKHWSPTTAPWRHHPAAVLASANCVWVPTPEWICMCVCVFCMGISSTVFYLRLKTWSHLSPMFIIWKLLSIYWHMWHKRQVEAAIELKSRLSQPLRRVAELGSEKRSYSWLEHTAYRWSRVHSAQRCFSRCTLSQIQLARRMCLWL